MSQISLQTPWHVGWSLSEALLCQDYQLKGKGCSKCGFLLDLWKWHPVSLDFSSRQVLLVRPFPAQTPQWQGQAALPVTVTAQGLLWFTEALLL